MKPAPIVIFAFNRPETLEQCLFSLSRCWLINESTIIVYCDGPGDHTGDEERERILRVRNIAKSISFGKRVEVIERKKNFGLHDSVIQGTTEVISIYEHIIVLEDDIVVAQNFIPYMNKLLDYFRGKETVFSITAFSPPVKMPKNYTYDVYFSFRCSSWGWGSWKDRWVRYLSDLEQFNRISSDLRLIKSFDRGGDDLPDMLNHQLEGKISSWAIKWQLSHHYHDAYCVYPVETLLDNIGFDHSGTHTKEKPRHAPQFSISHFQRKESFNLPEDIIIDKNIMNNFRKLFIKTPAFRVSREWKRMMKKMKKL